jgi:hypothetical protein
MIDKKILKIIFFNIEMVTLNRQGFYDSICQILNLDCAFYWI